MAAGGVLLLVAGGQQIVSVLYSYIILFILLHLTKSSQIPLLQFIIIIIVTSALIVGKDYPHPDGLDYVRRKWKEGLRDPENCKLINKTERISLSDEEVAKENERIIRKAVGRGRYVSIQLNGFIHRASSIAIHTYRCIFSHT